MTEHAELDLNQVQQGPKWADATLDDLEVGLLCALGGESYAERCLIEYFLERMTAGQPYMQTILCQHWQTVRTQ